MSPRITIVGVNVVRGRFFGARLPGRPSSIQNICAREVSGKPNVGITGELTVEPPTLDALGRAAWPFVAALTNVTDPGTFNAEYAMGNVATAINESRTP